MLSQVLHMLRGAQAPGPAFHLDKRAGHFEVVPGTHVAHLSQGSLHHVLERFAAAATDLLRFAPQSFTLFFGRFGSSPSVVL